MRLSKIPFTNRLIERRMTEMELHRHGLFCGYNWRLSYTIPSKEYGQNLGVFHIKQISWFAKILHAFRIID